MPYIFKYYFKYLSTAKKLEKALKIMANKNSTPKSSKRKSGETTIFGMPRKKDDKKGVAYKSNAEAISQPKNAPKTA